MLALTSGFVAGMLRIRLLFFCRLAVLRCFLIFDRLRCCELIDRFHVMNSLLFWFKFIRMTGRGAERRRGLEKIYNKFLD